MKLATVLIGAGFALAVGLAAGSVIGLKSSRNASKSSGGTEALQAQIAALTRQIVLDSSRFAEVRTAVVRGHARVDTVLRTLTVIDTFVLGGDSTDTTKMIHVQRPVDRIAHPAPLFLYDLVQQQRGLLDTVITSYVMADSIMQHQTRVNNLQGVIIAKLQPRWYDIFAVTVGIDAYRQPNIVVGLRLWPPIRQVR